MKIENIKFHADIFTFSYNEVNYLLSADENIAIVEMNGSEYETVTTLYRKGYDDIREVENDVKVADIYSVKDFCIEE